MKVLSQFDPTPSGRTTIVTKGDGAPILGRMLLFEPTLWMLAEHSLETIAEQRQPACSATNAARGSGQKVYRADQQIPKSRINGIIHLRLLRRSPFGPVRLRADFRFSKAADGVGCLDLGGFSVLGLAYRTWKSPSYFRTATETLKGPLLSGEREEVAF
jgi:hypothetical protein